MSKHDDYLQQEHDYCQSLIAIAQDKAAKAIEPFVEQFQKNTMDNIPQQFGDFLYSALGDRVTGQRSSVLNETYLNNREDFVNGAKEAGLTFEQYAAKLKKDYQNLGYYERRWAGNTFQNAQLWITTGRAFGVSYVTGDNGDRVHTNYFSAGQCFKYLTQEHVNCVKNKLKRTCVQDFLDFRNDYIAGISEIDNILFPVDVPVSFGVVSTISKCPKINKYAGSYRDETKRTYQIMDDIVGDKITHIVISTNAPPIWDKISQVDSSSKNGANNWDSFLSLLFINIDEQREHIKKIGNIDIAVDSVTTSMQKADRLDSRSVLNVSPKSPLNENIHRSIKGLKNYAGYSEVDCAGVTLNMDEIITHPDIKCLLDKSIAFYNTMSERLQALKHKHASLYFINADI